MAALLAEQDFAPDLIVGHSAGRGDRAAPRARGGAAPQRVVSLNGALTPFRGVAGVLFPPLAKLLSLNPLTGAVFARTAGAPGAVHGPDRRHRQHDRPRRACGSTSGWSRRPSHVSATLAMMARWDLAPLIADLPRLDARR